MSSTAHPKGTASATQTTEKIHHVELPNLSVVKNVTTTVSVVTVTTSESTVLSAGRGHPLEVPTLPSKGSNSSVPSKVTSTPSPEGTSTVPPKGNNITGSTVNDVPLGPEPEVLAPSVSVETSVPLGTVDSTASLEVTNSESIEGVPDLDQESIASVDQNVPLNIVQSTESASSNITTSEPVKCNILPEVSVIASEESSVPSLNTVESSTQSVPMDPATFESIESIPSGVFTASTESHVLLNPIESTDQSAPLEVIVETIETIPMELSLESTVPAQGTIESTESAPLEVTSEISIGSTVPLEESTASSVEKVPLNIVKSTESTASSNITRCEPPECILPKASAASEESAPSLNTVVESTESVPLPMEVITFESIDSVPSEVFAASVESVPLNPIESTESAPLELVTLETSAALVESTVTVTVPSNNIPPPLISSTTSSVSPPTPLEVASDQATDQSCTVHSESLVESTEEVVVPPDVANSSTGSAPSEVTIASCPLKPKQKVTIGSTENINRPQSTTASNGGAPSTAQTEPSSLTSGPDQELITKAREDASQLHRAFKGLMTCDATTIVNILSKKRATHRTLIREEYKAKFSEDFDHRLSRELQFKPKLQRAMLLWMDEPARRDAKLVKHGLSIHMNAAIEVICSRTPSQIEELKEAYHTIFGVDILEDIKSHAHFDHKKLLLAFAGNQRSGGLEVDKMKVEEDAKVLFKDGEWKLGTTEETFIRILSERSSAHLATLNSTYQTMYVNSLKKAVKKETSFKFKFGLLTILQCAENRGKYFAKALHKAMKGAGTRDENLTRIIVSRAEVDIQQIKIEYKKKYGKELSDDVHSDTSGHYRAFLLSLLNLKVA